MQFLYSVLSFVVAIGVLVTVHEFGHYWVARRLGVKVLRFSVGFGRPLLSRRAGADGTEYVLAAVPLGGYVRMLDESEGEVDPAQRHRAFNRQSLAVRSAVVAAGPVANFLFAILAYALMFMLGVSGLRAGVGAVEAGSPAQRAGIEPGHRIVAVQGREVATWDAAVQALIAAALEDGPAAVTLRHAGGAERTVALELGPGGVDDLTQGRLFATLGFTPERPRIPPLIGAVESGGPADRAGMRRGDRVLSADGEPVADWAAWVDLVRARPGETVTVVVERGGARHTLRLTPESVRDGDARIGRIGTGVAGAEEVLARYYVSERLGPWDALVAGARKTAEVSLLTLRMFWRMLTGDVSLKNLSGPISIGQYAGVAAERGVSDFLYFLGVVSVSLGILNLLPVPLLDGGHLLYYAAEFVRGRPLPEEVQYAGQRLGIALLVGLMGLAFYNDFLRLLG
jgi:regulator of sigma E protease